MKINQINEFILTEWWDLWSQATQQNPEIGQFMGQFGYNANSKSDVKAFVKQNPGWVKAMGKAYGAYANIGKLGAKMHGAANKIPKDRINKGLELRDKVKDRYPGAFDQFKKGDAMGALKTIGVTDSVARHIHNIMVEAAKEITLEYLNETPSPLPITPQEIEKDKRQQRHDRRQERKQKLKQIQKDLEKFNPPADDAIEIDPEKFQQRNKEFKKKNPGKPFAIASNEGKVDELKIEKPDSKDTKGIKRAEMPQVATKDYPEFIEYLKDNGAKFEKVTMPAKALKATQGEFSDAGVERQLAKMQAGTPKKPIIASEDNYIIDGHHRWLVAWNTRDAVEVFKVNMDADELLALVKKFPKTTYKDIYTEELYDFNKDEPNKSIVAVPGYGTMSVDGLTKNVIDQATELVKQMSQGTQGMRNADYALNKNKVLASKVGALVQALDDLQAIRSKGGPRSRNIQQENEQEQEKPPLPIDTGKIFNYIQRLESGQNIEPQDADLMRRGVQGLASDRQTVNPQAILQLLTLLTG
jgi:hypothetical protein